MNKILLILTCAIAAAVTGCKSITVNNRGQALATDGDGQIVKMADGNPLVLNQGWRVDYFQHWNWQRFDTLETTVKPDDIRLAINNYQSGADTNLNALVHTSLTGLGTLALNCADAYTKIYGGGAITDNAINAGIALFKKFKSAGGDDAKATVSTKDGNVSVTDGTITCTGDECYLCTDGNCQLVE